MDNAKTVAALTTIAISGNSFGVHHSRVKGLINRDLITPSPSGFGLMLTAAGWDTLPADLFGRIMTVIRRDAGLEEEKAPARTCTCGAGQFRGCFCEGLTLSEFLASPGKRTAE